MSDVNERQPEAATAECHASPCSYTLPHYRHILRKAKQHGYWLPMVRDVAFGVPDRRFFLIRHDVDINPWAALAMARVEHEEGAIATYYFRLHAPYYNLFDQKVRDIVMEIRELGHEVGLHYEPGFFLERDKDPVEGTRNDIQIFEDLVGFRTHSIAQHQPAQGPVLGDIDPDRPCAYQPALVRGIPYFGDSGHHWREGCICTKLGQLEQIHTLIHPSSWTFQGQPWQQVLRDNAAQLNGELSGEIERYIAEVTEYLAQRPRLDAEREARYEDVD